MALASATAPLATRWRDWAASYSARVTACCSKSAETRFQSRSACSSEASACSRRARFRRHRAGQQLAGLDSLPQHHRHLVNAPAQLGFECRMKFCPHRADDFLGHRLAICSRRSARELERSGGWTSCSLRTLALCEPQPVSANAISKVGTRAGGSARESFHIIWQSAGDPVGAKRAPCAARRPRCAGRTRLPRDGRGRRPAQFRNQSTASRAPALVRSGCESDSRFPRLLHRLAAHGQTLVRRF